MRKLIRRRKKLISLHRYHNLQHKDAACTFDSALAVIFFCGGADVGQTEAVEQGVFLGGFAAGVSVRQGVVFHRDDEHVVDAAGFYGDDAPGNGEFLAGLDGIIEGVAEDGADIQRIQEAAVGKVDDGGEVDLFFAGSFCLVPDDDVQVRVSGAVVVLVGFHLLPEMADGGMDAVR